MSGLVVVVVITVDLVTGPLSVLASDMSVCVTTDVVVLAWDTADSPFQSSPAAKFLISKETFGLLMSTAVATRLPVRNTEMIAERTTCFFEGIPYL